MPILNRIELLGPAELNAFLIQHCNLGNNADASFAKGLIRLLLTQLSLIADHSPTRVGRITVAGPLDGFEGLAWNIWEDPSPDHPKGRHVLNGGLVRHSDGSWGIHT